jgi:hypothetical protein
VEASENHCLRKRKAICRLTARNEEYWKSLNALLKNIENAEACLQNHDLKMTADHLKVAKWNVGEVKKAITAVGQSKKPKGQPLS